MNVSKHLTNVALFPLCDARGALRDALCDTSNKPTTNPDSLILAWRLELPDNMTVANAADALLSVAMSGSRENWSRSQVLILNELMALAGRDTPLPTAIKPTMFKLDKERLTKASRKKRSISVEREAPVGPELEETSPDQRSLRSRSKTCKESKEWWRLVGNDAPDT